MFTTLDKIGEETGRWLSEESGGLLARSDAQRIVPTVLVPSTMNPQGVVNSYYYSDANGNVTALVSPSGTLLAQYEYGPFGNMEAMSGLMAGVNKYRFSSKEWNDNAGLYYYGYRFYEPNLQRWVNRNPIGEYGGITLYRFVGNSPIGNVDPNGKCLVVLLAVAAALAVASEVYLRVEQTEGKADTIAWEKKKTDDFLSDPMHKDPGNTEQAVADGTATAAQLLQDVPGTAMNRPFTSATPQKSASEGAQKALDTAEKLSDAAEELGQKAAEQAENNSDTSNATGCKCQKQ